MQVSIRNRPLEVFVQTVSLTLNKENPTNLYLFHCFRCGKDIAQVNGSISRIAPGLEPADEIPVINQCEDCREKYVFQTKSFLPQSPLNMILSLIPSRPEVFYCVICRTRLTNYDINYPTPTKLQCHKADCGLTYNFIDIVSRDTMN